MRNSEGSSEAVPKSFVLACKVGQSVTCYEDELDKLEPGRYDVLSREQTVLVTETSVLTRTRMRLRRVI